jgi:hypothetical protein
MADSTSGELNENFTLFGAFQFQVLYGQRLKFFVEDSCLHDYYSPFLKFVILAQTGIPISRVGLAPSARSFQGSSFFRINEI